MSDLAPEKAFVFAIALSAAHKTRNIALPAMAPFAIVLTPFIAMMVYRVLARNPFTAHYLKENLFGILWENSFHLSKKIFDFGCCY
jgi:hypothetical protein